MSGMLSGMPQAGDVVGNPLTGERVLFRRVAADTRGELLELELWLPAGHVTPEHVHPGMEERWEVLGGEMVFTIDGREVTMGRGDTVAAGAGVPHGSVNVGRSDAHLRLEFRPALRWEEVVVALCELGARAVAQSRSPTAAELGELIRTFPDELALADPLS